MKLIRYFLAASLALASGSLLAQAYPNRPVTLVVPFAAGGPTDVVARSLGQAMTRTLGQSVVIENKLGAGGTLAANSVAKAAPDGYTVLIHHNGMATAPALYRKLPFNPLTDFEYVSQVVDVPMTLLGRKDLPPNNLRRADHLRQGERRQAQPGARRPGRGVAPLRHGVPPGGRRRAADRARTRARRRRSTRCSAARSTCSATRRRRPSRTSRPSTVKLYGVTTSSRINALPQAPTLDEQGLKGFQVVVWHGVYVPKGTPAPVIEKLQAAVRAALKDPAFAQRMTELGAEIVPDAKLTTEGLRSWLQAETDRYGPMIRKAGAYAD